MVLNLHSYYQTVYEMATSEYEQEQLQHWNYISSLKTLKQKLQYYNTNIKSLSLHTMAGDVYIKLGYGNVKFLFTRSKHFSASKDFESDERITYGKLRLLEVKRILAHLKAAPDYRSKLEFLSNLKGGGIEHLVIVGNHKWDGVEDADVAILYAPLAVDLRPKTQAEIEIYNRLLEKRVLEELTSNGQLNENYQGFNFQSEVEALEKMLTGASTTKPKFQIKTKINEIVNFTGCADIDSRNKKFIIKEFINIYSDEKLDVANLFCVLDRSQDIPYDKVIYCESDIVSIISAQQLHQFYTYCDNRLKYWKKSKPENKIVTKELKDIFVSEFAYKEAITALRAVNKPVIDTDGRYCLGPRQKSSIAAWIRVLSDRGDRIHTYSNAIMAAALNAAIPGLDLYQDGGALDDYEKTPVGKRYYVRFAKLISPSKPSK